MQCKRAGSATKKVELKIYSCIVNYIIWDSSCNNQTLAMSFRQMFPATTNRIAWTSSAILISHQNTQFFNLLNWFFQIYHRRIRSRHYCTNLLKTNKKDKEKRKRDCNFIFLEVTWRTFWLNTSLKKNINYLPNFG